MLLPPPPPPRSLLGRVASFALTLFLAAVLAGAPLAGCKKRNQTATAASAASAGNAPRVRIVHAISDGPAVDIYASGIKVASGLAYKADTGYVNAVPGTFSVRVSAAGASDTVFGPVPVTLAAGTDYSVVAIGTIAEKNVRPLILTDDKTTPNSGRAKIRVVHAAPDAPAVDIFVNARPAISNLRFGQATPVYTELPAAAYQVSVNPVGGETPLLGPLPITLAPSKTYTLLVMGRAADRTLNVQALTDR